MSNRKIIVIADAHLGVSLKDTESMIDFIRARNPLNEELLVLGDLFHIWAGPERYHSPRVTLLIQALENFRARHGKIGFVVGNRDFFFPNYQKYDPVHRLPFDLIANDFAEISFQGHRIVASHGDLVNQKDKQYLRWRKIGRSSFFRLLVRLIPQKKIQTFMLGMEERMRKTNIAFRIAFPEEEWKSFLQQTWLKYNPQILLVGHFHPENPIVDEYQGMQAIVVPAWQNDQAYLEIDTNLQWKVDHWNS